MRRPAIDELLRLLPPKTTRQTMLFSATYPSNIASLAGFALRPGFVTIDTVGEDAEQTADKVSSCICRRQGQARAHTFAIELLEGKLLRLPTSLPSLWTSRS